MVRAWRWAALTVLVALSTALRAWAGSRIPTPWIMGDEAIYAELGRSLYETGRLEILGRPTPFYSFVYPALIGRLLSLEDVEQGYQVLKIVQAHVMSLVAVPVYLWARSMTSSRWALVAAALAVAPPALAYSGLVMTEVAFYPVLVLTAWAIARSLATPTLANQFLALGAIVLAVGTRLQALVLVFAFPTAVAMKLALGRSGLRSVRAFAPSLLGLIVLAAAWSAWQLVGAGTTTDLFGAYAAAGETSYSVVDAARFVAWHAADLLLAAAVIPVCAVALLFARARTETAHVQAYLAVTASLVVWFVIEVGVFASRHVGRLAERDLVALLPILFVGFGIWLDRGAPRPRLWAGAVAGAFFALVLYLPVERLVSRGALADAFMLAPLYRLNIRWPTVELRVVVVLVAILLLGLLLFVPRRRVWVLPAVIGIGLAAASVSSSRVVAAEATLQRPDVLPADARWIDHAAGGVVAYLYSGEAHWNAVYENIFWNRRLRQVRALPGFDIPGPIPQDEVVPRPEGHLVGSSRSVGLGRYVVASRTLSFFGTRVAEAREPKLLLWRVVGAPRLSTWVTGMAVFASASPRPGDFLARGDIGSNAKLAVYACEGGELRLSIAATGATDVALRRNGREIRRFYFARSGQGWTGAIEVEPAPGVAQCEIEIVSSRLVHATQFDLVRG